VQLGSATTPAYVRLKAKSLFPFAVVMRVLHLLQVQFTIAAEGASEFAADGGFPAFGRDSHISNMP